MMLRRRKRITYRSLGTWFLVFASFALFHDVGACFVTPEPLQAASEAADTAAADAKTPAAAAGEAEATVEGHAAESAESHSADGAHAEGDHGGGGHADPVAPVLLAIVLILLLAKTGGDLFERFGMPAVLGELTVGVLLGNFALFTGWDGLDVFFKLPTDAAAMHGLYNTAVILKILASIGVILLLFEVGLESTVADMMSVGVSSLLVAILGVIAPIILGWLVGWWLIPEEGWQVHAFLGATLCATSVGITARVLKDLGRSQQRESQIILGAAVIDDVLGLIVLAVVSGVIVSNSVSVGNLALIVIKAFGFLAGAMVLGTTLITKPLFRAASFLRGHGLLVSTSLVICFGFSWLANLVGLAPIVGAFAAGLILEKTHYQELNDREHHHNLEEALSPLTALLVPIFFVQMGTQVDLASFQDPSVWGLATALTVAAILGKQVCSFGVLEGNLNKLAIGLGMIPRGEVGLIFADVGRGLMAHGEPVINVNTFSSVVVMVMVTTMVTPPLLKWSMVRGSQPDDSTGDAGITEETAG